MNKKGFQIGDLLPIALVIVVAGIGMALGLTVLSDFREDSCDSFYNATSGKCFTNSTGLVESQDTAFNGTGNAIDGVSTMTGYLPTIGLVAVVAIVIGILVVYLMKKFS